jgi:Na+-translocating ferredoxin:NAD+ oxidoreductase RnfG subunit
MAPMTVGNDIDAVSRATITNNSAVRAIRESARRMAREFIAERTTEQ